uniref:BPTI/Kunitz inhibitor domain-containing protein n=1 Tax=Setaria digitata TaxID=48799 RepID=A0A915PH98_9BILA
MRNCPNDTIFNVNSLECVEMSELSDDINPFLLPQFQAPEDLCGGGIPMTRLSSPVICNPSINSCPDGYVCTIYARTGTAYCCQNSKDMSEENDDYYCPDNQVTYLEAKNGKPQSCSLADSNSCPTGFTCTVVRHSTTAGISISRCCGKYYGCPQNSAAQIDHFTGSYVACSAASASSCQNGFECVQSSTFDISICCSETNSATKNLCPVGKALNDRIVQCSGQSTCPTGYFCVTNGNENYCCPSHEKVCSLPHEIGNCFESKSKLSIMRYYFDTKTGTCRSFNYSGCGGNDNNFLTLDQCHAFCLAQQCEIGIAYRMDALNAACSPYMSNTCPKQFTCHEPLFGPVSICCPNPEIVCNEMPSAGTNCFGRKITFQRYYFDQAAKQCRLFQYFGCSGNSNNFRSKMECEEFCLSNHDEVCDGSAPLKDPSGKLQKCTTSMICPSGYYCNEKHYCCPKSEFACSVSMSSGRSCAGSMRRTVWYYNAIAENCMQFMYLGCGGTANRFATQQACMKHCIDKSAKVGNCPLGMSSYMMANGKTLPQVCKLNTAGSCPKAFSCVPSTTNIPICCKTEAVCPKQRVPYIIPGSDSTVNCQPDRENNCPSTSECMESSVKGFYMCCLRLDHNSLDVSSINSDINCPANLPTTGEHCQINGDNVCPSGYICLNRYPSLDGLCCKAKPTCLRGKANLISGRKVQICGSQLDACPKGTACLVSSVPNVNICCKFASLPVAASKFPRSNLITPLCSNGRTPFYDSGSRTPRQCLTSRRGQCPNKFVCQLAKSGGLYYCCPVSPYECANGRKAYIPPGLSIPQTCSLNFNSCPAGYSCHPSADGSATYCCLDFTADANCPNAASPYLYANRPLACPAGSNRCPTGYNCIKSTVNTVYLCCSVSFSPVPMCLDGIAYIEPVTNEPQVCSPLINNCPPGYHCQESTTTGHHLCCTSGHLNTRYTGYCPMGQIPYVRYANEEPQICHMTLRPCPTIAQYLCIYSAEKLNSYCCAPIDTTFIGQAEPYRLQLPAGMAEDKSGCPQGSQVLIDQWNQIKDCNPGMCPQMYSCHYSAQYNRYQCCLSMSSSPIMGTIIAADTTDNIRLLYLGQKGCKANEQCTMRTAEARCNQEYCTCPRNKLIHQSKCVTHCPEGFIDIAGRCRDLTTIVFMDSVEERVNGTIGGFCKNTIIAEEQCDVDGSYCNEISITCQCKPGYELRLDTSMQNDIGSCIKMEESRFANQTSTTFDEINPTNFYFTEDEILTNDTSPLMDHVSSLEDDFDNLERYMIQTDDHDMYYI